MAAVIINSFPQAPFSLESKSDLGDRVALVVEDHEDTRLLMVWLLESWGYRVVQAKNGEEALGEAQRWRPDLILMDAALPRVDGIMATRRIRQLLQHDPRIIFISGYSESDFRARAFAAGCDDYLMKPLDVEALAALLKEDSAVRPCPEIEL
jgi:CheY-like chemotaxis protein